MANPRRYDRRHFYKHCRVSSLLLLAAAMLVWGYLALRLAVARTRTPAPEIIFVLGGGHQRERLAARLGRQYPELPIWISSGISLARSCEIFRQAGIAPNRVRRDNRATDTVTNFTSLADELAAANFEHVYVVTNDFHRQRAAAIATVVLGSRGIAFTFALYPRPDIPSESPLVAVRDAIRSLGWLLVRDASAPQPAPESPSCPTEQSLTDQ